MKYITNHFRSDIKNLIRKQDDNHISVGENTDLRKMAQRAMNYFLRTPRPALNYACRFSNSLHKCPPGPQGEDLVANGDTDVRMDSILPGLRELSGIQEDTYVDEGLHKRIMGYVGRDNLSYAPCAMCCTPELPAEKIAGSLWTTGMTIRSLTERWLYSHNDKFQKQARNMAMALLNLAHWDKDMAYYPGAFMVDGVWFGGFFGKDEKFYTPEVCNLLYYATTFQDKEILDFAYALARGIVAGLPGKEYLKSNCFREDGSFTGHTHLHTRVLWGVAMAGRVMQDAALIEWARRGYEVVLSCGTDFGWFPERIILPGEHPYDGYEERVDVSETCITGDMVQIAAELAKAGDTHYWDHVERYIKNYLHEVQFSITPQIEEFYRNRHSSLPVEEVEKGLTILRDFEGGFLGCVGVNDSKNPAFGPLNMPGCCPPGGARALVTAWKNTVVSEKGSVKINMAFPHDENTATVKADANGMKVTAKQDGEYLLRPPAWIERESVQVRRAQKQIPAEWSGDYILFEGVKKGGTLEISYKVPHFLQQCEVGGRIGAKHQYTIAWQGNSVIGIEPGGTLFPMFQKSETSSKRLQ